MFRAFLYHSTCREGHLFTDEVEYQKALVEGWVNASWKVVEEEVIQPSTQCKYSNNLSIIKTIKDNVNGKSNSKRPRPGRPPKKRCL